MGQSVHASAEAAAKVPAAQLLHAAAPGWSLYWPAGQVVQDERPSAPLAPGGQVQSLTAELAKPAVTLPAGHGSQAD